MELKIKLRVCSNSGSNHFESTSISYEDDFLRSKGIVPTSDKDIDTDLEEQEEDDYSIHPNSSSDYIGDAELLSEAAAKASRDMFRKT